MSKLGKKAILLPKESTVKVEGDTLLVSGPKGTHKVLFNSKMFSSKINEKNEFHISPISKDKKILQHMLNLNENKFDFQKFGSILSLIIT